MFCQTTKKFSMCPLKAGKKMNMILQNFSIKQKYTYKFKKKKKKKEKDVTSNFQLGQCLPQITNIVNIFPTTKTPLILDNVDFITICFNPQELE